MHAELAARRRRRRACARTAPRRRARSRRRSRTGPRRRTPAGTYRNAPPLQKAALAASSLWRSIVRRLEYQRATSSVCSRKASSSEHRITPRSASAGSSSTCTTAPSLCTIRPARGRSGSVRATTSRDAVALGRLGVERARGRGSAGSSSRSPSGATPAARRPRRRPARPRAARPACARRRRRRRPARGRASPRGGVRP